MRRRREERQTREGTFNVSEGYVCLDKLNELVGRGNETKERERMDGDKI